MYCFSLSADYQYYRRINRPKIGPVDLPFALTTSQFCKTPTMPRRAVTTHLTRRAATLLVGNGHSGWELPKLPDGDRP